MANASVAEVIAEFFVGRGKQPPAADVDLFATEAIDSMELLDLVLHLEHTLNIEIQQELMSLENFRTITAIARTVGLGNG